MATKAAIATLVLRILGLVFLAGSVAIFVTNKFSRSDGTNATFKDVQAYEYAISVALLGFLYSLFQVPFAVYHVSTEKRLIRHDCLPVSESYADQVIAYILATAVGAGFGATFEYKKILPTILEYLRPADIDEEKSRENKFLDRGNIATGVLFLGFICVAAQAMISSKCSNSSSKNRGFFG